MEDSQTLMSIVEKTSSSEKSAYQRVKDTETEELIIGLCGPIGTNIHEIASNIKSILINDYNYDCSIIKLSDIIREYAEDKKEDKSSHFSKTKYAIREGNKLREKYGSGILAELAINKIAYERTKETINKDKEHNDVSGSRRKCYIIDSLKNVQEYEILRAVYRDLFYFFGIFSPYEKRKHCLTTNGYNATEISDIIIQDYDEKIPHGQGVVNVFKLSDFFLRVESDSQQLIELKIKRYLHLIFDTNIVTPTTHETSMYIASSAAGNSACLSRQVGAAITNEKGELLSVGWNDVPSFGGNLYFSEPDDFLENNDKRCKNLSERMCFNDHEKRKICVELVNSIIEKELISESKREDLMNVVKKSRIKSLIEFSRAVHAEMHAIIIGSQKTGSKMVNGKLFCTTYPCHNCARHIVVAGIKEVYYIEPYTKSLGEELHYDSITENETEFGKVRILVYDGVAPSRYIQFFKMEPNSRKILDSGKKKSFTLKDAKPKFSISLEALKTLESITTKNLIERGFQLE